MYEIGHFPFFITKGTEDDINIFLNIILKKEKIYRTDLMTTCNSKKAFSIKSSVFPNSLNEFCTLYLHETTSCWCYIYFELLSFLKKIWVISIILSFENTIFENHVQLFLCKHQNNIRVKWDEKLCNYTKPINWTLKNQ